jgi:hypothetical protein
LRVVQVDRRFLQCSATFSRKHDQATRIVQLQNVGGDGDQVGSGPDEIADGRRGKDMSVLAEDEIVDLPIVSFLSLTIVFNFSVLAEWRFAASLTSSATRPTDCAAEYRAGRQTSTLAER